MSTKYNELTASAKESIGDQQKLEKALELKQIERQVIVPTSPDEVKHRLRELGEPVTLFGEGPYDRAQRLRRVLATLTQSGALPLQQAIGKPSLNITQQGLYQTTELFYTVGSDELRNARLDILNFSVPRALVRLEHEMARFESARKKSRLERDEESKTACEEVSNYSNLASQIGGKRPVSSCAFDATSKYILTGCWDHTANIWSLKTCEPLRLLHGHSDRVVSVAWHPNTKDAFQSSAVVCCASGSADRTVRLWSLGVKFGEEPKDEENPEEMKMSEKKPVLASEVAKLEGHEKRVGNILFHPSGQYLCSTSYDHTWRLWDVKTATSLLEQEGHAREVYGLDFNHDGSLLVTTDLSGIGRAWDLRSGKSAWTMEGHNKQVLSVSFSPDGHTIATGSDDNTCRVWDLRKRECIYTIAAHSKLISTVKYQPGDGRFIFTSSYDCTAKIWDARTFTLRKTLIGHTERIMRSDISANTKYLITCSFDKTWKLWKNVRSKHQS